MEAIGVVEGQVNFVFNTNIMFLKGSLLSLVVWKTNEHYQRRLRSAQRLSTNGCARKVTVPPKGSDESPRTRPGLHHAGVGCEVTFDVTLERQI